MYQVMRVTDGKATAVTAAVALDSASRLCKALRAGQTGGGYYTVRAVAQ